MFNNLINNIKNKIDNIKEENENYNIALNNSIIFDNLKPITQYNNCITENSIQVPGKMYHYALSNKYIIVISNSEILKKYYTRQ